MESQVRDNERIQAFCRALLACEGDPDLVLRFLRDAFSRQELEAVSNRWAAACMLLQGRTQTQTATELALGYKTVNKVAQWVTGPFSTGGFVEVYRLTTSTEVPEEVLI